MFQRHISREDIRQVLDTGTVIETYPDDTPYPSRLILGWQQARPLHLVVAENIQENEYIVITAYQPDANRWEADFSRRKPS